MASSRPGRRTFDSLQALRPERCDRDHKDGRPPDNADLVVRALAFLEGFEADSVCAPTAERLPAAGTQPQDATSPAALRTASDGRHGEADRADRSGQATAEAVTARRERQVTGGHQTGRASAEAATRRADRASARPDQYEPCQP
jgi:hypothetical protein